MNIMKYQNDKEVSYLILCYFSIVWIQKDDYFCKNLRFYYFVAGNGCVQQDFAALPRNDGLRKLKSAGL